MELDNATRHKGCQVLRMSVPDNKFIELEQLIYDCSVNNDHVDYIEKILQVTYDIKSNPLLLKKDPLEIVALQTEKCRNKRMNKWYKQLQVNNASVASVYSRIEHYERTETEKLKSKDILKCRKCGCTNISVIQKQIRSFLQYAHQQMKQVT